MADTSSGQAKSGAAVSKTTLPVATAKPPPSHPAIAYQPLRLLYQLASAVFIIARIPIWATQALVPALRPRKGWTAKQTFMTSLFRSGIAMMARVGVTETISMDPGAEGDRFVVAEPFPDHLYKGALACPDDGSVKPAPTGCVWYPRAPGADLEKGKTKVGIHVHGGAFVMGTGRADFSGCGAGMLLRHGGLDYVLCPTYRLSGYGGVNPFPAALQDLLTVYLHVVHTMRVPVSSLVLSGDSAGANLCIALLRYLGEFGTKLDLPLPSCAVLISPWVSPLASLDDGYVSTRPNRTSDYVSMPFLRWGARTYPGSLSAEEALRHPYITPAGHAFETSVPLLLVNHGTAELFHVDVPAWVKEMRAVAGNIVEHNVEEDALHDSIMIGNRAGFEESAQKVAERIKLFVNPNSLELPM